MEGISLSLEYSLLESIEIELRYVIGKISYREGNLTLDTGDKSLMDSIVLIMYSGKILSYTSLDYRSQVVTNALTFMLDHINNGQGFKSRRLKELMLLLNSLGSPEGVTRKKFSQQIENDKNLKSLVVDIKNDVDHLSIKQRKNFEAIIYCLIRLTSYLSDKKSFQILIESVRTSIDEKLRKQIDKIFNESRFLSKKTKDLILNVLFLKELPILFIALISLFSFFLGNQWEKNIFTLKHVESNIIKPKKIIPTLGIDSSSSWNINCSGIDIAGTDYFNHRYYFNFTSLQNDFLEKALFKFSNYDTLTKNLVSFELGPSEQKSLPLLEVKPNALAADSSECTRSFILNIENLEKDEGHYINIISSSKERPLITKINLSGNAIFRIRGSLLSKIIYVINNHSVIILLILVSMFVLYVFIYAKYNTKTTYIN
ncbi:MAG: hypothetical protein AAF363_19715 [Bacteroidota bacterium]